MKNKNKYILAILAAASLSLPAVANAGANEMCKKAVRQLAETILNDNDAAGMKSELEAVVKKAGLAELASDYSQSASRQETLGKEMRAMQGQFNEMNRLQDYEGIAKTAGEISQIAAESAKVYRHNKQIRAKFYAAVKAEPADFEVRNMSITVKKAIPEASQLSFPQQGLFLPECAGDIVGKTLTISYGINTGEYRFQIETKAGPCRDSYDVGHFLAVSMPACKFSKEADSNFFESLAIQLAVLR